MEASAYTGANKIPVAHESLKNGDRCPECRKGKLYGGHIEPAPLVRIIGAAPIQATVYELEKLRCNLCGEVFTAQAPDGVRSEKYGATSAGMVAVLKYGSGLRRSIAWNDYTRALAFLCRLPRSGHRAFDG